MDTVEQNFAVICRKFNQFLNRELQEVDLTAAELTYLNFLLEQNGMTQDELAKSLCVDKAAVTRMIQRMEKKALCSAKWMTAISVPTAFTRPKKRIIIKKSLRVCAKNGSGSWMFT